MRKPTGKQIAVAGAVVSALVFCVSLYRFLYNPYRGWLYTCVI
jgi:hypothetical protein